ncbi:hypothetical protein RDWZM_005883 [Blomia tropicalis]|uniref:Ubiquitin-like domain-containing protein n=1 Tax=Blomia tropicalis TaxID=40697 RepID=A0A9Q0RMU4_BLOTA|nr:hypothetical protein RDWZM_005883 [Blomia tropicalis]
MWRSAQYVDTGRNNVNDGDDWDTDPDFVNDVSEQDQRWGSKTVEGSGRTAAAINLDQIRDEVNQEDLAFKEKFAHVSQKDHSVGFGGKFGIQKDRIDKSAAGWEYHEKVTKHSSQVDASKGFGGKFGIESDRKDKSAAGWEYHEKTTKHSSQVDASKGFGGKFGVETDRKDNSAEGWEHHEKVEKHPSQVDGVKGFGGKFGVQTDRKDASAAGWEHHEKVTKHSSQIDASKGFGGKFGVETDRKDASAAGWEYHEKVTKHSSQIDASRGFGGKFGVENDRKDKSAEGWDHHEKVSKHSSQVDASKGFGGKFGIETDRIDKSAHSWKREQSDDSEKKANIEMVKGDAKSLRAKFENLAMDESESKKKLENERLKRLERDNLEKEAARKAEEDRQTKLDDKDTFGQVETEDKNQSSSDDEETVTKSPRMNKIGVSVFPVLQSPSPTKVESQLSITKETIATSVNVSVSNDNQQVSEDCRQEEKEEEEEDNENNDDEWQDKQELESSNHIPQQQTIETNVASQGITAIALFDYEAAESDEITFDPDELIINIEKIDDDDSDDDNYNTGPSFISGIAIGNITNALNDNKKLEALFEKPKKSLHVAKKKVVDKLELVKPETIPSTSTKPITKNVTVNPPVEYVDIDSDDCSDSEVILESTSKPEKSVIDDVDEKTSELLKKYLEDRYNRPIRIKVGRLGRIETFEIVPNNPFSSIFEKVSEVFNIAVTDILMYHENGKMVNPQSTPKELNIQIAEMFTVLARTSGSSSTFDKTEANKNDPNFITLHLRDAHRKRLTVRVNRFRTVKELAEYYAKEKNISVDTLILEFDEEDMKFEHKLDKYDLEDDDQIDVKVK